MAAAAGILSLCVGFGVAVLHIFLFLIARFYQRAAGEPTRSSLFLVSMALLLAGDLLYGWQGPPLIGNTAADLLLLAGGGVLAGNGYLLLTAMTRGR